MTDLQNFKTVYYIGVTAEVDCYGVYTFVFNQMFAEKNVAKNALKIIRNHINKTYKRKKKYSDIDIYVDFITALNLDDLKTGYVLTSRPGNGYDSTTFGGIIIPGTFSNGKPRNLKSFILKNIKEEWESDIKRGLGDGGMWADDYNGYIDVDGEHEYYYKLEKLTLSDSVSDDEINKFFENIEFEFKLRI